MKKNKLLLIGILIILFLLLVITYLYIDIYNKLDITYKNNYYSIIYDKNWTLKENSNNIRLTNKKVTNSYIDIYMYELDNKYQYYTLSELPIEKVLSNNNKDYNLINKEVDSVGNYKALELLYEDDNSNSYSIVYKDDKYLYILNYKSSVEYFDILLDSYYSVVYSFKLLNNKYIYNYNIDIDYKSVVYNKNESLDKQISKSNQHSIHYYNYEVIYNIPDIFKLKSFDSRYNRFEKDNIKINTYIKNINIYELLDKNSDSSIYNDYKSIYDYDNYKEYLEYKSERYIYKNEYTYNNEIYENMHIIYELDNKHIFDIEIISNKESITEKLINNIILKSKHNYSSYINSVENNNYMLNNMLMFYDDTKYYNILLSISNNYKEIDKNNNMYNSRYFTKNYNDKYLDYENYIIVNLYKNLDFNNINNNYMLGFTTSYGNYSNLEYVNDIEFNNLSCKLYKGNYTQMVNYDLTKEENVYYIKYFNNIYCSINNDIYIEISNMTTNDEFNIENLENSVKLDISKDKYE